MHHAPQRAQSLTETHEGRTEVEHAGRHCFRGLQINRTPIMRSCPLQTEAQTLRDATLRQL